MKEEAWNENVETCSGCDIQWKKIGKSCPVCFKPPEKHPSPPYPEYHPDDQYRLTENMENWREQFERLFMNTHGGQFRFLRSQSPEEIMDFIDYLTVGAELRGYMRGKKDNEDVVVI